MTSETLVVSPIRILWFIEVGYLWMTAKCIYLVLWKASIDLVIRLVESIDGGMFVYIVGNALCSWSGVRSVNWMVEKRKKSVNGETFRGWSCIRRPAINALNLFCKHWRQNLEKQQFQRTLLHGAFMLKGFQFCLKYAETQGYLGCTHIVDGCHRLK